MKNGLLILAVAALLCGSVEAYAGKPERDKAAELNPQVEETAKGVEKNCGCPVKVSVKWDSFESVDRMFRINANLESITTATKTFCETATDKKALCDNLSEFVLTAGSCANCADDPVYKDKSITLQSSDSAYNASDQIKYIMNKW